MGPTVWQPSESDPNPLKSSVGREELQPILQLLGLSVRSRRAALGSEAVMKAIRTGTAKVVFVASDAGTNGMKKYKDKCDYYQIPLITVISRELLSQACGRPNMAAVAVTDPGFAAKFMKYVGEFDGGDAFDKNSGV